MVPVNHCAGIPCFPDNPADEPNVGQDNQVADMFFFVKPEHKTPSMASINRSRSCISCI